MYRDVVYTSLAKVNPAFLRRLTAHDRVEGFVDTINDFAADAHFQIERQIIDQYTRSGDYVNDKKDRRKVDSVLRDIDKNVMNIIPGLIEQALSPGSEMMEQLEKEEEELEHIRQDYEQLMQNNRTGAHAGGDDPAMLLDDDDLPPGFDEEEYLNMEPSERLEHFVKAQLKAGMDAQSRENENSPSGAEHENGSGEAEEAEHDSADAPADGEDASE